MAHQSGMTRRAFAALPLAASAAAQKTGPRQWTIFVVNHSHIDVGYTERQEIITEQHADFVREALELALKPTQRNRAPEHRFKFTCEGFWQVEQFWKRASAADRKRLVGAMQSGLMELTAAYFHMTELPDQELLQRSVSHAYEFAKRERVPLVASMECDINGLSWGMVDALANVGVRYLSMNINPHHGGYPLGGPHVPFHWESPNGKRILAWNGMAYHKANLLGLMGGPSPDYDAGVPGLDIPGTGAYIDVRDIAMAERKLFALTEGLEKQGYRYDFLPVMGSGLYTDNSPPTDLYCDILAQWNRKHGDRIRLRSASLAEFFQHVERHAGQLPVYRGEWTDWWSDGAASTPVDTILYRSALRSRRMVTMLDPKREIVPEKELGAIDEKLLLYAEHTFGYSHTAATHLLGQQVFLRKSKHAIDADELASTALYRVLRRAGEGMFTGQRPTEYTVVNPLDRPVKAAAYLPLDYWETLTANAPFRVVDAQGREYAHQNEPSPRGTRTVVVVELAAKERRRLRMEAAPAAKADVAPPGTSFANRFYRVAWQPEKGIVELADADGRALIDSAAQGGIACPIYQLFPGGNRGAVAHPGRRVRPRDQITVGRCARIRRTAAGPVYERWEFDYKVPGADRCTIIATFFRELPHIEITFSMVKTDVRDPEGMYALFPLAVEGGSWYFDKPGAIVQPGRDQLPKACADYFCIQNGAALIGKSAGIALATLDAPLVHIGKMRLWDYSTSIEPVGPLYSWLTNNKWETNFRLSCGGAYEFRYALHASSAFADKARAFAEVQALSYPPLTLRS